jgi:hypothetical protein
VPEAAATVVTGQGNRDVFEISGALPSHGVIRGVNRGDVLRVVLITTVDDGATDEQALPHFVHGDAPVVIDDNAAYPARRQVRTFALWRAELVRRD